LTGFNPRAPAGRDISISTRSPGRALFQSTRPCGARQLINYSGQSVLVFQSTRPCGARQTP